MDFKGSVLPPSSPQEIRSDHLPNEAAYSSRGWPSSPKSTRPPLYITIWNILSDVVFLVLSAGFLIFALVVNHYDQASTAEHPAATRRLLAASKYGPSVFPILFAAILGRATHAVLIWRLERGELIGNLDVLAGSTSLTSTATSLLQLRRLTALGAALIIIWGLSPVGGQGTIRQLNLGDSFTIETTSFNYTSPGGNFDMFKDPAGLIYVAIADTLFNAAIVGTPATKTSPRDSWGNAKIPRIETLEAKNSSAADEQGWFDVLKSPQEYLEYASLVGVPMSGIDPGFVNYNFNIDTTYLHLNCSATPKDGYQIPDKSFEASNNDATIRWVDDFQGRITANTSSSLPTEPIPFVFTYKNSIARTIAECSIESAYVEVEIACKDSLSCGVSKIRRSKRTHFPAAYTPFDLNNRFFQNSTWEFFSDKFLNSVNSRPNFGSMLDAYMISPLNPFQKWLGVNATDFSGASYSLLLGQLINSYWACMNNVYTISGGVTAGTAYLDTNATFMANAITPSRTEGPDLVFLARTWAAQGTRATVEQVIMVHKGWVVALAFASVALIAASLVSPVMRLFLIKGPDVLMNISSLATRNNPLIPIPPNGTYMDGADRSGLLKDIRVRFGDVGKDSSTGSLAIGALEDRNSMYIARISRRKTYE